MAKGDSHRHTLARAAGLVAALAVVSRALGFVREMVLADVFGATGTTDAYLVALSIPTLAWMVAGTSIGVAFMPVYAGSLQRSGREAAYRSAHSVLTGAALLMTGLVVVGELAAGPLVRVFAPGFGGARYAETVVLLRILLPTAVFHSVGQVLGSMLMAEGRFGYGTVGTTVTNLVLAVGIALLGPYLGIRAAAWVGLLASVAPLAIKLSVLRTYGFRWRPVLDPGNPDLIEVARLALPVMAGAVIAQAIGLADKIIASSLAAGSIAALGYGARLAGLPHGVVGSSITTAVYPKLSRLATGPDLSRFRTQVSSAIRMSTFTLLPLAIGLIALREPLVRLVFQRGAFDERAAQATAFAVLFLGVGTLFFSLQHMMTRTLYSLHDTRTPLLIGSMNAATSIGLKVWLVGPLQHGGLVLGSSLGQILSVIVLGWVLARRIGGLGGCRTTVSLLKTSAAGALMWATLSWITPRLSEAWPGFGLGPQIVRLMVAVGAGATVYGVSALVLKIPEARTALDALVDAVRHNRPRAGLAPGQGSSTGPTRR